MFSTILDRITSFFDRRALLSAFFPSLIFWIIAFISIVIPQIGWSRAVMLWNSLNGLALALLFIGFLAWVAFWSFLTLNFRAALLRLYEGYWKYTGLSSRILEWRRKHWKKRRDRRDHRDRMLEDQEVKLRQEIEEDERFFTNLPKATPNLDDDEQEVTQQLEQFMIEREASLKRLEAGSLSVESLQEFGQAMREQWCKIRPWLNETEKGEESPWAKRIIRLTALTEKVEGLTKHQLGEVQAQRERIYRDIFLYYPQDLNDIMPTRLGNVFKATEVYAWKRYHIDSVILWSRLQSTLPTEFTETLQDAKTSLDLMIALAAFILLFGFSLSAWFAVMLRGPFLWWLPLVVLGVALVLRFYTSFSLALVALILSLILLLIGPRTSSPLATIFADLQMFFVAAASVLILSCLCYQNAVQAAIEYGEKIKSAIDLYRWKVLEALHLQLPANFEAEQKLWDDICGLLARGYKPESGYYRYIQPGETQQAVSLQEQEPTTQIPVPRKDLPALRPVAAEDITERAIPEAQISIDALCKKEDIIGRVPLKTLPAAQPIGGSLLVDPKCLENTVTVGFQASPAMALGGNIKAGDIVDIIIVPEEANKSSTAPSVFENLLLLESIQIQENETVDGKVPNASIVVVVALPLDERIKFIDASAHGTLLLSRKTVLNDD